MGGDEFPGYASLLALVGREWKQPIKDKNDKTIPLTIANTDGGTFIGNSDEPDKNWTTTDRGWQQSWIQYDEDNFPVVSRDGKKVFFNTQWPPVSPITFTQKFKLNNEERIVNLNSDGLTFASTGESKKGSEWLSNEFSAYKYDGTDSNYGPDEKTLRLASDEMYTLYEVSNVWIAGDFKIWSGTNGWRFNNSSTGSEWDSNVQFGAYDTTTNPNLYNKATSSADANKELPAAQSKHTYGLKTYEGDMTVATPTYFQKVYLFYNTMDANDNSNNDKSRLFFLPAVGNAQIMALNSKDLDHGTFLPSIDAESLTAKSVKVEVFNRKGQSQGIILNSENLSLTSSEFNNAFSTFAPDSYNSGYFTDENHITYKQNGYYHYVMTVAFSDGSSVSVPSPEYLISNVGSNLFTAQLVEVQEGAKSDYPYNYVTYSTTTDAYGVAEDNGSYIVTKLDAAPGADFYSDANKALWTNKVLMYSQRPWTVEGYVSDGVAYEATGWTATANGTATASASGDVDYVNVVDADGFNERQYATQMSYKAGGVDQNAKAANSKARLLYPTACMAADQVNVVVSETPEVKDVTLSAENHHGHADATAFGGATYTDMEVSHLDVVAALDMPNVTVDLQNLLKIPALTRLSPLILPLPVLLSPQLN